MYTHLNNFLMRALYRK